MSKVSYIFVYSENNYATVQLDTTRSGLPACATQPMAFAFKIDTDVGKAWLSQLMAAKLAGTSVTIFGTHTCPTENPQLPSGINSLERIKTVEMHP